MVEFPLPFAKGMKRHWDNGVKSLPPQPGIFQCAGQQITERSDQGLIPTILESLDQFPHETLIPAGGDGHLKAPAAPLAIRTHEHPLHRMGADRAPELRWWPDPLPAVETEHLYVGTVSAVTT